jgi:hypothetical protein
MNMKDEIKIIEEINKMDKDCAIRAVLSMLGGKKKFVDQYALECNIMKLRYEEKK